MCDFKILWWQKSMAVWIFPAVWRNLRSASLAWTSFSSLFGGGGGGGSVDFDRDRFLAFVVVAAIVLNSLNTSVFRCVRFLRQEFFLLFCKKVELILGCFFTFFLFSSTKLSTSFSSFDVVWDFFVSSFTTRQKKFSTNQLLQYNNGIFFNLLRVCRTTTKSLLREEEREQQKESFGPNQSRFLRAFLLRYVLSFFMFM